MSFALDPTIDPDETDPLILGGVEFRIAPLAIRQNRKIGPMLADVIDIEGRRIGAMAGVQVNADGLPDLPREALAEKQRMISLSEAEWNMLTEFVRIGLSRCHPGVTFDDLLDLPVDAEGLLAAVDAVAGATRLTRRMKPGTGEPQAASR